MLTLSVFNGKPYGGESAVIPLKMLLYLRALAFVQGMTLRALYEDCASRFLAEMPWTNSLKWRDGGRPKSVDSGWMRVDVRIPRDLADCLEDVARREGVGLADVLYTMLFWYSWVLYPPLHEQERRKKMQGG